jgi:hypothetical protein
LLQVKVVAIGTARLPGVGSRRTRLYSILTAC